MTIFRGAEEKMKGNVYQVNGETGKRPNQCKRTTKEILQLLMREFESPISLNQCSEKRRGQL